MWPLVTLAANKFLYFLGSILLAANISVASGGATAVTGGAIMVPDFTTAGVGSRTAKIAVKLPFAAYVKGGTGSTTIKYPASCFKNPLNAIGSSSGTVVRLTFHVGNNPTGVGGDIGIVKGCGDLFGSGVLLIDNVNTATGSTSYYTTGTALLGKDDYIKFTPRAPMASGFTGRITGEMENIWGE